MMWTTRPRSDYAGGIKGIRSGRGPVLVLIHGVGLRAESWAAQLDGLDVHFDIHALDLPGHGESNAFEEANQLSDFTDRMAMAIADIGAPVFLAGHSLGALITLDLVHRHGRLIEAFVALNGIHRRAEEAAYSVKMRAQSLSVTDRNDPTQTLRRWFGDDLDLDEARACANWLNAVDLKAYKKAYTLFALSDTPSDGDFAMIKQKGLIMTGDGDPNSTPEMAQKMAEILPNGQSSIIEHAAHMAMMTHPEKINKSLHSFFLETSHP